MNKRITPLALVVTLILTVLATVVPAYAATTVSTLTFNKVIAPVAEVEADFTLPSVVISNGVTVTNFWWEDESGTKYNSAFQFAPSTKYTCVITAKTKDGYVLPVTSSGITAKVNGNAATGVTLLGGNSVMVRYTFPSTKFVQDYIKIAGVTRPVCGAKPDTAVSGMVWFVVSNLRWMEEGRTSYMDTATEVFQAGRNYTLKMTLTVRENYNYQFTNADKTRVDFDYGSGFDAGTATNQTHYENGSFDVLTRDKIDISCTFYCDGKKLGYAGIADLQTPKAGNTIDVDMYQDQTPNAEIVEFFWADVTSSSYSPMKAGMKYEAGHTYELFVYIKPKAGYYFEKYPNKKPAYTGTILINGDPISRYATDGNPFIYYDSSDGTYNGSLVVSLKFTILNSVAVTGLDAPAAGAKPDSTVTLSAGAQKINMDWYNVTKKATHKATDPFEAGSVYRVSIDTRSATGYTFANNMSITVNGMKATGAYAEKQGKTYCTITYTFPATAAAHTHTAGSEWKSDAKNHWHVCSCGTQMNVAAHTFGSWKTTKNATNTETGLKERSCLVCGYKETASIPVVGHTHKAGAEWKSDSTNHWHACSCGEKMNSAAHTFGEWTVTKQATETDTGLKERVCTVCSYTETADVPVTGHKHEAGTEWKSDSTNHWHECSCGEEMDSAAHTFGEWTVTKEATETENGMRERSCTVCGYVDGEAITASGEPIDDSTDMENSSAGSRPSSGKSSFPWWILIVAAVLIVAGAAVVIILIVTKNKKKQSNAQ